MTGGVVYVVFFASPRCCYVGSSFDYWKRWGDHLRKLRKGKHHNDVLQKVFNEQGEFKMRFVAIACLGECTSSDLEAAERHWINHYVEKLGKAAVLNRSPMTLSPGEVSGVYSRTA